MSESARVQTRAVTGDEAMKFFATWKSDNSPRGSVSIDPATRDIVQDIQIRRSEWKDGKLVTVEIDFPHGGRVFHPR